MKKIICLIIILIAIGAEASSKYYYATAKTEFNLSLPVKNVSGDNESSAATQENSQENSSDDAKMPEKVLSEDEKNNENNTDETEEAENTEDIEEADNPDNADNSDIAETVETALIVSRLEKTSFYTSIAVKNINNVYVDLLSGDEIGKADTIFISLENEDGVIKSLRIGLDEAIDKLLFAEINSDQSVISQNVTGMTDIADVTNLNDEQHFIQYFVALDRLTSPVILIKPDGEHIYFENGKALATQPFEKEYEIESIKAVRDEFEIRIK